MIKVKISLISFLYSFNSALSEWIKSDLIILIYVIKLTVAALLAMSMSMYFNLSSPQTSVFTVFIVMQIHSGLVFSKSFYRFVGTLIGFIVSLFLVSLFSQDRVWFMACFTIWIAICAATGFKHRNFMSYGFVLSGYTVALIVLPHIQDPLSIYSVAIERLSEVTIGLLSASVISDVVFPERLSNTLFENEKQKFKNTFLSVMDMETIFKKEKNTNNFSKNILGSDSLLVNSIFESNINKKNKMYYRRLNSEFMHLSITFHSLKNIIYTILNNENDSEIIVALQEIYQPMKSFLSENTTQMFLNESNENLINKFNKVKNQTQEKIDINKNSYTDFDVLNDLDSLIHLVIRFFDEFSQYTKTYVSFINNNNKKEDDFLENSQSSKLVTYTDDLLMLLASFRSAIVLVITSIFWILTGWDYATLTIIASVATTLMFSSMPNPVNASKNFLSGAVISFFVAGVYNFYLIPTYVNDITTFCFVLAPVFAFAAWLGSSPQRSLFSFGFIFIIISVCSMSLHYVMDYVTYFESSIAILMGIAIVGVAYELINSWSETWTKKRVSKLLCNKIIELSNGKLNTRRVILESEGLDLIQHFSTQGRLNSQTNTLIFQLLLSSLEIGRAIVKIKNELQVFTKENQPQIVYEILHLIEKYFLEKDTYKQENIFLELKNNFMKLEKNRSCQSVNEQRSMRNIYFEVSLIYTLISNKISLPLKGAIH